VLELDVGVVNGPNDSIDVSRDGDEEGGVAQSLDSTLRIHSSVYEQLNGGDETHLDDLSNFDVADPQEALFEHRGLQRQLYESIDGRVSNDTSAVVRPDLPGSILGDGSEMVVCHPRDLHSSHQLVAF
jgi:hypothetical protein